MRLIISFNNLTQTLKALKLLNLKFLAGVRPVSTPSSNNSDICGMSIEILNHNLKADIIKELEQSNIVPALLQEIN